MTDPKKARNFEIIAKVKKTDLADDQSLSITPASDEPASDDDDSLRGLEVDHHAFAGSDDDDDDIYDPAMAGYDPRMADELNSEQAYQEFLIDCAIDWLPELPLTETLLEHGITLDYGVLMSAKVLAEELGDDIDEGRLDAMLSALLLFGEEDEHNRREFYDLLTGEAQEFALILDEALAMNRHEMLADMGTDARLLMFAGIMADVEVLSEDREEEGEEPAYEDLQHMGALMDTLSQQGDLPPRLIARARDTFNKLASDGELPLYLLHDGNRLSLTDTAPSPQRTPKPPRP